MYIYRHTYIHMYVYHSLSLYIYIYIYISYDMYVLTRGLLGAALDQGLRLGRPRRNVVCL